MAVERILYCEQSGRPPPGLRPLSWRDTRLLDHRRREHRAGLHADWRERAQLLTDVEIEAGTRYLSDAQVHEVLGLRVGALRDGTLATPVLIEAAAHMRRLPRG